MVLNDEVHIFQPDLPAANGIIHRIDGALPPPFIEPILPHRCDIVDVETVKVSSLHLELANVRTYNYPCFARGQPSHSGSVLDCR